MNYHATRRRPQGSLDLLADRYRPGIGRYLRLLGCAPDVAEDLLQELFLAVWRRGSDFEHRTENATRRYLRTCARNLYVDYVRRQQRELPCERELDLADSVWDEQCSHDDGDGYFEAVASCLAKLGPRAQRAVVAAHVEERSRAEIATELGLRHQGIKSLLARAMTVLRECVKSKVER